MKQIKEYSLLPTGTTFLSLPLDAEILGVIVYQNSPALLWAEELPASGYERSVEIQGIMSGQPTPDNGNYLGTLELWGMLYHFFLMPYLGAAMEPAMPQPSPSNLPALQLVASGG